MFLIFFTLLSITSSAVVRGHDQFDITQNHLNANKQVYDAGQRKHSTLETSVLTKTTSSGDVSAASTADKVIVVTAHPTTAAPESERPSKLLGRHMSSVYTSASPTLPIRPRSPDSDSTSATLMTLTLQSTTITNFNPTQSSGWMSVKTGSTDSLGNVYLTLVLPASDSTPSTTTTSTPTDITIISTLLILTATSAGDPNFSNFSDQSYPTLSSPALSLLILILTEPSQPSPSTSYSTEVNLSVIPILTEPSQSSPSPSPSSFSTSSTPTPTVPIWSLSSQSSAQSPPTWFLLTLSSPLPQPCPLVSGSVSGSETTPTTAAASETVILFLWSPITLNVDDPVAFFNYFDARGIGGSYPTLSAMISASASASVSMSAYTTE